MCESNSSNVTGLRSDCIVAASSGNISAAVEGDLSSLHEGRRDHRSHRLGVGTDVEAVRERHRDVSAGPPRCDCTGCNDFSSSYEGGRERRQVVPRKVWLQSPSTPAKDLDRPVCVRTLRL